MNKLFCSIFSLCSLVLGETAKPGNEYSVVGEYHSTLNWCCEKHREEKADCPLNTYLSFKEDGTYEFSYEKFGVPVSSQSGRYKVKKDSIVFSKIKKYQIENIYCIANCNCATAEELRKKGPLINAKYLDTLTTFTAKYSIDKYGILGLSSNETMDMGITRDRK